jgi:hypothetical protein
MMEERPHPTTRIRFGFKGRDKLPIFMIWKEYYEGGEFVYASVIFNSMNWIGV